jgi:NAD(P)-dependent dehydrogenase (short-subunit alcohol dehydrogenase family)
MSGKRVVLITGSSSGFGRLSAQSLARKGYTVFASMRGIAGHNARNAEEVRALASAEKLDLHVVEMDVTDDGSVERCVAEIGKKTGQLDVVVNNAAFGNWGITEGYSVEQFKKIFETNFFGIVRVNRAVLPMMRRKGSGLLIHVSSGAGRVSIAFMAPYCATKFALEALADAYRFELAPLGIDSVLVEPGEYRTPIFDKNMYAEDAGRVAEYGATAALPKKLFEAFAANMSGPMAQDPQEVADAIVRLIEMPAGQRPLRTLVGQDTQPLQGLNQMSEEIRRTVMSDLFRMPGLLELKVNAAEMAAAD